MSTKARLKRRLNTLYRYKAIADYYSEIYNPDIPLRRLWQRYIYPKFFVSYSTFDKAISLSLDREIEELKRQLKKVEEEGV